MSGKEIISETSLAENKYVVLQNGGRLMLPSWSYLGEPLKEKSRGGWRYVTKCHFGCPENTVDMQYSWENTLGVAQWKESYQAYFIGPAVKRMHEELGVDESTYCAVVVGFGPPLTQCRGVVKRKYKDLIYSQLERYGYIPKKWLDFDVGDLNSSWSLGSMKFSNYVRDEEPPQVLEGLLR